jgi:pilus assembly protein CpaC
MRAIGRVSFVSLGVVLAGLAVAQEAGNIVSLGVGTQKVLSITGIQRIAIGDPSVADVKALGSNQLLVIGSGEGRTTLLVWKTNGQRLSYIVTVSKKDPEEIIQEIKRLLGDREGITVRKVGDRIYLDGYAYTTDDNERVEQIVNLYPNVKSFVKIAPNAKKLVANNLNAALQKAGLKNVQANVVGTTIFLEGSVESQQDLQKAELITKAVGEHVENLLVVGIKRMVLSEVQFVELRRSSKDDIGITWPLNIVGTVQPNGVLAQNFLPSPPGFVTGNWTVAAQGSTGFALQFLFNEGYGRLLAQPKLVCASGEKSEFLSGGEVPIPLVTANTFTVEFKEYGTKLKVHPTADRQGNIQTEIEAEVSQIDTSVAVGVGGGTTIPGFLTRKVKTNVTVRHGETIVLSGVFTHDEQKNVAKFPGLGHIPIIGELFKERDFTASKTELVIFVTPRIVNPDTERVRKIIEDIKVRYKEARDEVNFSIFD